MIDDEAGLQRRAGQPPRPSSKPMWLVIAILLVLAWTGAWLFHLGQGSVLAASLAMLILGLMATGIRAAPGHPHHGGGAGKPKQRRASAYSDAPRSLSPDAAGNLGEGLATPLIGKRWSLDVFAAIDAQRFAAVCETWFSWAGFDTRSDSRRNDQGVDIWLHAAKVPGPVAVVRCKHSIGKPVGVQEMAEFLSFMTAHKSAHGTFTTTSTYTPEALQLAKENGIDAVDGRGLLRRIKTRTRQRQQALLAVAYHGLN